jgi:ATP-binding cassette subfamily B protein
MIQLHRPLQSLSALTQNFLDGIVNTERVFRVLKETPKVVNLEDASEIGAIAADVEFDSVTAGPLKSLTFRCEPETTTVILGLSNCERSVLVHPLARVIDTQVGIIKTGGVNIRAYSMKSLRHNVWFIPQDCKLLGKTVTECLKYGMEEPESIDTKRVITAC